MWIPSFSAALRAVVPCTSVSWSMVDHGLGHRFIMGVVLVTGGIKRASTAPNRQTSEHWPHFTQRSWSMTWAFFRVPEMHSTGQFREHTVQPMQLSGLILNRMSDTHFLARQLFSTMCSRYSSRKLLEGAEHGVRRGAPQAAQGGLLAQLGQTLGLSMPPSSARPG